MVEPQEIGGGFFDQRVGPGVAVAETNRDPGPTAGSSVAAAVQRQHRLPDWSSVPAVTLLDRAHLSASLGKDRVDVEFVHECSLKTPG